MDKKQAQMRHTVQRFTSIEKKIGFSLHYLHLFLVDTGKTKEKNWKIKKKREKKFNFQLESAGIMRCFKLSSIRFFQFLWREESCRLKVEVFLPWIVKFFVFNSDNNYPMIKNHLIGKLFDNFMFLSVKLLLQILLNQEKIASSRLFNSRLKAFHLLIMIR